MERLPDFRNTLEQALSIDDSIVFDHVIPTIAEDIYAGAVDDSITKQLQRALTFTKFFREKISNPKIIVPRVIYRQILKGYHVLSKNISVGRRKSSYTSEQEILIREYLKAYFEFIKKVPGHFYRYESSTEYQRILTKLIELDKRKHLRKDGHNDDGFADGIVVATAFCELERVKKMY